MASNISSYTELLACIKANMFQRNLDSFWYMSTENAREMKTQYSKFDNMTQFIEWLEYKASAEQNGRQSGAVLTSIAGSC